MSICLEVMNGRSAGTTQILEPGDLCRVGSRVNSNLWLADDRHAEPSHCVIAYDKRGVTLHDLSMSGTFVNRKRVEHSAPLQHGDWFVTGTTLVMVCERGHSESGWTTVSAGLAAYLHSIAPDRQLWYLGECGNSPLAEQLLQEAQGAGTATKLDERHEAWLAWIPPEWVDFPWFLRTHWGKGHGLFFRSDRSGDWLAAHFRARLAATRKGLRPFDPRVVRALLPICRPDQLVEAFGPARRLVVESQLAHTAIQFFPSQGRLAADLVNLRYLNPPIPRQSEMALALRGEAGPVELYQRLAPSFGIFFPRDLEEFRPDFARYGLIKDAALVQFAILGSIYSQPEAQEGLRRVLGAGRGWPEERLDRYVAALNERRG